MVKSDLAGQTFGGNCRWASDSEQHRNRRDNVLISFDGQTRCVAEWAELTGIKPWTIRRRLEKGLSAEKILATT